MGQQNNRVKLQQMSEDDDDEYNLIFKLGNKESAIRCRLLLSCFQKDSNHKLSTSLIVLLIVLTICAILFCLYSVSSIVSLISSVLVILNSANRHFEQISIANEQQQQFNNYCQPLQLNHESDCNDLINLLSTN